jgi:hypothetical protein
MLPCQHNKAIIFKINKAMLFHAKLLTTKQGYAIRAYVRCYISKTGIENNLK